MSASSIYCPGVPIPVAPPPRRTLTANDRWLIESLRVLNLPPKTFDAQLVAQLFAVAALPDGALTENARQAMHRLIRRHRDRLPRAVAAAALTFAPKRPTHDRAVM